MTVAFGLAFLFMGVAHFIGVGVVGFRDHYVSQWGDAGEKYRWFAGLAFIALGLNFLAAAMGLPHVDMP